MQIRLHKKIKPGAVIVEGFPGLGLVGTIATEFLIDHLEAEQVGEFWSDKVPAIVAIPEDETALRHKIDIIGGYPPVGSRYLAVEPGGELLWVIGIISHALRNSRCRN